MVIHEWWGLNDYAKNEARELAKLVYMAMAVDIYDNKMGNDPQQPKRWPVHFMQTLKLLFPYLMQH
jgi:dienelactone hydrolase